MMRALFRGLCLALATLSVCGAAAREAAPVRLLDAFDDVELWRAVVSDDVQGRVSQVQGVEGNALRFDFDFGGGAGYAAVRRALPLELPENYEISFSIRGTGPANNLEFKLSDASGENVWWYVRRAYELPDGWRRVVIRKRHIEFAWGPTQDRALRRSAFVEFVVSAGEGGAGAVEIDNLSIRTLPVAPVVLPAPSATAASQQTGFGASQAVDSRFETEWRSELGETGAQTLTIDLGLEREFGGLTLRWADGAHASRYDVELSSDGVTWVRARSVSSGDGGVDHIMLTESEAQFVRLSLIEGPGSYYGLSAAEVRDLSFGASPNNFLTAVAAEAPRGAFPRGFQGEQSYWTLVGVDGGGPRSALISEDGALELGRGGISLEPFLVVNGRRFSWADIQTEHSLRDEYLPIPSVTWRQPDWDMRVTAFAAGTAEKPQLLHRYEVVNRAGHPQDIDLVLAVRPMQVNPPQQFLNTPGGFSPIRSITWADGAVSVNGMARIRPLRTPDAVRTASFDDFSWLWAEMGEVQSAQSEQGLAAAALTYRLHLEAGERARLGFVSSLADAPPTAPVRAGIRWLDSQERVVAGTWRDRLSHVSFTTPPEGALLVNTIRSSVAYILMSRDGPALQPGTRSYARSWIRDGAMMSEGLLRMGQARPAREYMDWYAPYQFESGKVPCCVDARGADPVPENDSQGELIHLSALLYRYTSDRSALERDWPHVQAALHYMQTLRQSERTAANRTSERRALFGLMPPSISHEGYSARPAYSYWDNYWALLGYEDAVDLATARGDHALAEQITEQQEEFAEDVFASVAASAARFGVDYLPGAADLGDFDATSTTIALSPAGLHARLPQNQLNATFERYWLNFSARSASENWNDYTPYELRTVGAFVRLGQRGRANEALSFFFSSQRPQGWNQWAEVVGREARRSRFVGDMPHGWVASDYLRSALDMFAYERAEDDALVLAAGVPEAWLEGEGIGVSDLETQFGALSFSIRRAGRSYVVRLDGDARPPGGFVVALPKLGNGATCVNGAPARGAELRVTPSRRRTVIEQC